MAINKGTEKQSWSERRQVARRNKSAKEAAKVERYNATTKIREQNGGWSMRLVIGRRGRKAKRTRRCSDAGGGGASPGPRRAGGRRSRSGRACSAGRARSARRAGAPLPAGGRTA